MDPTVQNFYCRACSILSLTVFGVFFCLSRFVELQFADSKLPFSIFMVILLVALSTFASNPDPVRTEMDRISTHRSRWIRCIFKAFSQFIILALVTTLIVWIKYPRFRVSDISATSKQGDLMGFIAAGAFSLYILSTSMLLKLREEFGLFYLSLEYTMTAAVEMPDPGGHTVNWRFVVPTAIYCFLLISFRCYCHSSDEVGRTGDNYDDDHGDDDDARGARVPIRSRVASQLTTGVGEQPITWDEENQQGGDDDGAGEGGETGDQRHRKHPNSSGGGSEIASADEGDDDDDDDDNGGNDGDQQPAQAVSKLGGDELRRPELELNQQGDGDDGAEGVGGGGGIERGAQERRDIGGSKIASADEGNEDDDDDDDDNDEHITDVGSAGGDWEVVTAIDKADRDEGKSSGDFETISSTSNVLGERVTMSRKQSRPEELDVSSDKFAKGSPLRSHPKRGLIIQKIVSSLAKLPKKDKLT